MCVDDRAVWITWHLCVNENSGGHATRPSFIDCWMIYHVLTEHMYIIPAHNLRTRLIRICEFLWNCGLLKYHQDREQHRDQNRRPALSPSSVGSSISHHCMTNFQLPSGVGGDGLGTVLHRRLSHLSGLT